MQKPANAKGTRDFGPEVVQKRNHILQTIRTVFEKFGFMPIQTPALENLSTLTGKYGNEGDKLLFKVLNSGDLSKNLKPEDVRPDNNEGMVRALSEKGLRYDLTVPFARFVAQHRSHLQFPFRRYQIQEVWRADRPQKGRYREFTQCDADIIGSNSLLNEADLLLIYNEVFGQLGLPDAVVKMNHRKLLEAVVEMLDLPIDLVAFSTILDKLDKIGPEGVVHELAQRGVSSDACDRLFGLLGEVELNAEGLARLRSSFGVHPKGSEAVAQLEEVFGYLQAQQLGIRVQLDLSLARGLDYYTGCIFEAAVPNSGIGSVSGGGRYDDLTGVFGLKDVSGVGISFGIDRIYDILEHRGWGPMEQDKKTNVLFCHFDQATRAYAFDLAQQLRSEGLQAEVFPDIKRLNKQLDYANKTGRSHVIVIGEEEMASGRFDVKDMQSGVNHTIAVQDIIPFFHA